MSSLTTRVSTLRTALPQEPGLRSWSSGPSMVAKGAISVWPYRFHRRTLGSRVAISFITSTGMMDAP